MELLVLGSGAGGGFPQWNCNCPNCAGLRAGRIRAYSRTQSSICITADGRNWVLVNASPDLRQQLTRTPLLQPARASRDTGIQAVILIDSQLDHTSGLLTLREGKRLPLYTTAAVYQDLTGAFPLVRVLEHYCGSSWHEIPLHGRGFTVAEIPGLEFQAIPLASKAPPYCPQHSTPRPGETIGLLVRDPVTGGTIFYAPGIGRIEPRLVSTLAQADCVLLDGTFWSEDEMQRLGVGKKRAADMGHLPLNGPGGLLELLRGLKVKRKILIHINNTNPILDDDSPERQQLAREGIELAWDGMHLRL
ncbi:pyrroloquinoline quinone biosynthesis protein PqqB [Nitrococcus mobilis]|uniref:pyrroloquinoline quinone biosynthesis protein PqqB n=1 Tax=Nitrococcus mobilis TaxID=35797 RepID=UPI0002E4074C|nr:pyrroloquinoline quinone biosynthesis protein PqqB [Nitrococcus mobilis]